MADKKISQLTALAAANLAPSTDVLAIVDTSATETKKIVAQDLINGVLNVASAVGIGTASPGSVGVSGYTRLVLGAGSGATDGLTIVPSGTGGVQFTDAANVKKGYLQWDSSTGALALGTAGTTKVTLDSSGNLGLGVTPSASWFASAKAMQIGSSGAPYMGLAQQTTTTCDGYMLWGARLSGDRAFQYTTTGDAVCAYRQNAGTHNWFTAGSGTAGNTITFTQAMTLDASGNLLLGQTTNTQAYRFVMRGSSGSADDLAFNSDATRSEIQSFNSKILELNRLGNNVAIGSSGSGNLGIGTTSPTARLHVAGATGEAIIQDSDTAKGSNPAALLSLWGSDARAGYVGYPGDSNMYINQINNNAMLFLTNNTARGRFTADGYFIVGVDTGSYHIIRNAVTANAGNVTVEFQGTTSGATSQIWYGVSAYGANAANAATKVAHDATTTRSINAGGTINASGADYAEYMTKAGDFALAKGDVCGVDANGKLTNVFVDAIAFLVKSTNPSYVGGDSWGFGLDGDDLEAARQKVDRIAFSGQVPVNVLGATPGQYIVPVNDNGAIKGIAVSNPTFEQYQSAVGKVIAVQDDGRALIIVKVA